VTSVKVQAEMQTPSGDAAGQALELEDAGDAGAEPGAGGDDGRTLGPGQTMQKILRLNLKEEGNHTLGVTVTYTEPADAAVPGEAEARVGKVRTFRKLYQFVALPLLGVRTKAGDLPAGENGKFRFVVEAQLENVGERAIVLEVWGLRRCKALHVYGLLIVTTGSLTGTESSIRISIAQLGHLRHRCGSSSRANPQPARCYSGRISPRRAD